MRLVYGSCRWQRLTDLEPPLPKAQFDLPGHEFDALSRNVSCKSRVGVQPRTARWPKSSIRHLPTSMPNQPEKIAASTSADEELDKGLKDSFPASDPPSSTQPGKSLPDGKD